MPALEGGNIVWNLDINKGKLSAGLSSARGEIKNFADDVDGKFSGAAKTITSSFREAELASRAFAVGLGAVATAAVAGIGFGTKIAGDLEAARQGFVALLGSAEEADATMARIKVEAAATPFELTGLVTGAQALTAITKDGDKAVDTLLDVGKAIATSGKGQVELDRVITNLQQVASVGQVAEIDIKEFRRAIPIFDDIIASAGLTVDELKNAENGADLLFDAFQKAGAEGGIAAQGFAAQAGTFNQQMSNLKDNITILSSELVKQLGIFDAVKDGLGALNRVLGNQQQIIDSVKGVFQFLGENITVVAGAVIGALIPAAVAAIPVIVGLTAAFAASVIALLPFIAIGAAIGLAIKGIILVVQNWDTITQTITATIDRFKESVRGAYEGVKQQVVDAVQNIITTLQEFPEKVREFFTQLPENIAFGLGLALGTLLEWGLSVNAYFVENVPRWIDGVRVFFSELPGKIGGELTNARNRVFEWVVGIGTYLQENVPRWIDTVVSFINSLPGRMRESLANTGSELQSGFKNAFILIINEVSTWPGRIYNYGINMAKSFVDGVRNGLGGLVSAFVDGFNKARGSIEGKSPPKEGPLKNIDKWGFNIGTSWVEGFRGAIDDLNGLAGLVGLAPTLEAAPSMSTSSAFDGSSPGGAIPPVNVYIDQVNDNQDIDMIGREIGFKVSLLPK